MFAISTSGRTITWFYSIDRPTNITTMGASIFENVKSDMLTLYSIHNAWVHQACSFSHMTNLHSTSS